MPFIIQGKQLAGDFGVLDFGVPNDIELYEVPESKSETSSEGRDITEKKNANKRSLSKSYFAEASRRSREKKRKEQEELMERNNILEEENMCHTKRIESLRNEILVLAGQDRSKSFQTLNSIENQLLKEKVMRHNSFLNSLKDMIENFQESEMRKSLYTQRKLNFINTTTSVIDQFFTETYSSNHHSDWFDFPVTQREMGEVRFKYKKEDNELYQRIDFLNVPLKFDKVASRVRFMADVEAFKDVMGAVKSRAPVSNYRRNFRVTENEGFSRQDMKSNTLLEQVNVAGKSAQAALAKHEYLVKTDKGEEKTRRLLMYSQARRRVARSLLHPDHEAGFLDVEVLVHNVITEELLEKLSFCCIKNLNFGQLYIKPDWHGVGVTRGDYDDTCHVTFVRSFSDFKAYTRTILLGAPELVGSLDMKMLNEFAVHDVYPYVNALHYLSVNKFENE